MQRVRSAHVVAARKAWEHLPRLCLQDIERSYTLGPRAEDIVTNVTLIIASLESRTDAAEDYLSFGSIHPLYLQVKVLVRLFAHKPNKHQFERKDGGIELCC